MTAPEGFLQFLNRHFDGNRGRLIEFVGSRECEFFIAARDSVFELINSGSDFLEGVIVLKRLAGVANVEVNFVGDEGFNVEFAEFNPAERADMKVVVVNVQMHVRRGKVRLR